MPLDPDNEGLGNVRPEEVVPLGPDDEGLGNVRPEEVVLSSPRMRASATSAPHVIRVEAAR